MTDDNNRLSRAQKPPYMRWILGVIIVGTMITGYVAARVRDSDSAFPWIGSARGEELTRERLPDRGYVGSVSCNECHKEQYAGWKNSHHALAMQHATAETVLGDFGEKELTSEEVTSRFFKREGKFIARTEGPNGTLEDYEIRFTFGIEPLQQYLADFGDGRLQALPLAWDSRPKEDGGQRWFNLYEGQHIRHGDPLHWTGAQQNWNFMCAECHSTNVQRNFDPQTGSYQTTYSEISVSCESCHGPAVEHVLWARHGLDPQAPHFRTKGLSATFDERKDVSWLHDEPTGNSRRSQPRTTTVEIETCAICHSRRAQISTHVPPGTPIGNHHHVSLIDDDLYFPDGQIRGEVYEYGSFLQSRMFHAGVTCSDCHEPHSLQLRAEGNNVCLRCHAREKFDVASHTHHATASSGSQCANCHMPTRTYMGVDRRRDHSIRIPRLDLSMTLQVPNACTECHTDRTAAWAAGKLKQWSGDISKRKGFQDFAELFRDGSTQAAGVRDRLIDYVNELDNPAIARASALSRLDRMTSPPMRQSLQDALKDPAPLVRRAAANVYESESPAARKDLLPLLDDPVRDVRLEAARLLAGAPLQILTDDERRKREAGVGEYLISEHENADRPESHYNIGLLRSSEGRTGEAQEAFKKALTVDRGFAPAAVALANVYRVTGRDPEGEAVLRAAIDARPDFGLGHQALGLWLVRNGRRMEGLTELRQAASLDPNDAHSTYIYGIALASLSGRSEAIAALENGLKHSPNSRELLFGVATLLRDERRLDEARNYAKKLITLEPENATFVQFLKQLR
jgi:predicted CXXCH cytochrome family protein